MTIATGEPMYAADILNLLFFPKGTILMYDGTSWTDNVTLKGWYRCSKNPDGTDKVVDGYTVPDLQDRFIMGHSGGSRAGGNNSLALSIANLPAHGHGLSNMSLSGLTLGNASAHTHTFSGSAAEGGSHIHNFTNGSANWAGEHTHSANGWGGTSYNLQSSDLARNAMKNNVASTLTTTSAGGHAHTVSGTIENGGAHSHTLSGTVAEGGAHTHSISGGTISGTVDSAGSGAAFDNRPSYYTLIYIVKVTAAGS